MDTRSNSGRILALVIGTLLVASTFGVLPAVDADHGVGPCTLHGLAAVRGPDRGQIQLRFRLGEDSNITGFNITRDGVHHATVSVASLVGSHLEFGSLVVSDTIDGGVVETVNLANSFADPVVVAYIATRNGGQSVDVRVKNVTSTSFEVFMEEPDDEAHAGETVNWIVTDRGVHRTLEGDITVAAGTVELGDNVVHDSPTPFHLSSLRKTYGVIFDEAPALLATLQTYNNGAFMSVTTHNVTGDGFNVTQEAAQTGIAAANESVGFIAFEQGAGSTRGINYSFGRVALDGDLDGVDDTAETITYNLGNLPALVVQGATGNGPDGYWARGAGTFTATTATVFAEEDQVGDAERNHADEAFSFAALEPLGSVALASGPLPWDLHWDDTGMADGETHTYFVTPLCNGTEGPTVGPVIATSPDVPGAVRNLEAEPGFPQTSISPTTGLLCVLDICVDAETNIGVIDVDWSHPQDNGGFPILGYIVHRGTSPGDISPHRTVPRSSLEDTGLSLTQNYFYQVQAFNEIGVGPLSDVVCESPGPIQDPLELPTGAPCEPLI